MDAATDSSSGGEAGADTADASGPAEPEPLCPADPPGPCEACNCGMCGMELDACSNLPGNASEGPAQGMARSVLCEALVRCGRSEGCRGLECLCGKDPMAMTDCISSVSPPMGPCHEEALAAAETTDIATFLQRATSTSVTYAVTAARLVSECAASKCASACTAAP
jgi:hypothetical protein